MSCMPRGVHYGTDEVLEVCSRWSHSRRCLRYSNLRLRLWLVHQLSHLSSMQERIHFRFEERTMLLCKWITPTYERWNLRVSEWHGLQWRALLAVSRRLHYVQRLHYLSCLCSQQDFMERQNMHRQSIVRAWYIRWLFYSPLQTVPTQLQPVRVGEQLPSMLIQSLLDWFETELLKVRDWLGRKGRGMQAGARHKKACQYSQRSGNRCHWRNNCLDRAPEEDLRKRTISEGTHVSYLKRPYWQRTFHLPFKNFEAKPNTL